MAFPFIDGIRRVGTGFGGYPSFPNHLGDVWLQIDRANPHKRMTFGSFRQTVSLVATTAHAVKGDSERCFEVGMDGYVSEPIQTDDLCAAAAAATATEERSEKAAYWQFGAGVDMLK